MTKQQLQRFIELFNAGKYEELEAAARKHLAKHKKDGVAWKALGVSLKRQNKESLEATQKACELMPNDYESFFNLGVELHAAGRISDAVIAYNKAITINPQSAKCFNNLGNVLKDGGKPHDALTCYQRAIQLDPNMVEAYVNMGNDLLAMSVYSKACDFFEKALELNPNFIEAHSNLIFCMDLMSNENTESQMNVRKLWAENYADHLPRYTQFDNEPVPARKLRIGYVSGDFREHSAARVFGAMLMHYNKEQFEVFCYDNKMQKDDSYTARFKEAVDNWRIIYRMPDKDAAELIRADGIDILVDLSGHSSQNRLQMFALKPAPIQLTAWGYATGTGLQAMDAFLADPIYLPESEKKYVVEDVRYLPSVVGSYFPEEFPPVNALPAATNGYITFGCFNRLHKVTDQTFEIWCEILNALPSSKLIIKAGELIDDAARASTMWKFMRAGIQEDRIAMLGPTTWREHLTALNLVDIALDPFPHGGGVSAMESLMMGIPIISLRWPTMVGRLSASILSVVGLDDWVAHSANDYVKLALKKAEDVDDLVKLRGGLREQFEKSSIGDPDIYVPAVEKLYRDMWQEWCAKQ